MLKKPNRIPRLDLPFVPDSARSDVLQWAHNSKLTCHPRTTRTIQFIQQPFWWLQFLCWSLGGTLRPSCPLSRFPVISTTSAAHLLSISLHHCLHLSLPDPGLHCQSINVHPWYTGSLLAHAVTLHLSSMPSGYLSPSYRIRQDLVPAQTARSTKIWFDAHAITVLDWPASSPALNLYGILLRGK
ncbi:uncharacterized protein edaradd isoform X7 [Phyllopteryx taeniolatus]|uniref:uncharacterized protein edaradd isoform X7 n=1 Tax=Phyllopteryx taeniolatus TaxID=161469 RepID=UPI002AD4E57C|nr:uncharacterized protein edaradd isoform X7 [Phyllopteryx taeniolatus]